MYLYPDFRTGFQGSFREGQFLSGHEAYLVDCYTDSAGIIVPVLRPRPRELLHTRMVGTFGHASDPQVRLRDPYESRCVYVARSRLPGAAEGLFARRSIEINTVVAFYNGEQVCRMIKILQIMYFPDSLIFLRVVGKLGLLTCNNVIYYIMFIHKFILNTSVI